MTELRFELKITKKGQADIVDWFESEQKNAICIYNDLGVPPYSAAPALCDLLNDFHEKLESIQKICTKYNINIEDLPDILEEYILIDNEVIEQKNIQNIIKEAYLNERTALGKSVLKQLIEQIGDTID